LFSILRKAVGKERHASTTRKNIKLLYEILFMFTKLIGQYGRKTFLLTAEDAIHRYYIV